MNRKLKISLGLSFLLLFFVKLLVGQNSLDVDHRSIQWNKTIDISKNNTGFLTENKSGHTVAGINANDEVPDTGYGSQYCRLLDLGKDKWIAVYTVRTNKGYQLDSSGGLRLEIAQSTDNGIHWKVISRLKDPGRDLDNGQLIQLKNGHILLACRSVRWQSSYRLPVYESPDGGLSWKYLSLIDANEGNVGTLGHPDKGVYEPHFQLLADTRLSVFYANEKHVTESPSFSQVISERVSTDNGKTWGKEIWVAYAPGNKDARPGMPVITKMKNDSFMVVFEVCGTAGCNIYQKTSKDGIAWVAGIGSAIADQTGAPYILSMTDGNLIVTSNRGNVSFSDNYGQSWRKLDRPWLFSKSYEQDWKQALWPSIYQFGPDKIGITAAIESPAGAGGHHVMIRTGHLK